MSSERKEQQKKQIKDEGLDLQIAASLCNSLNSVEVTLVYTTCRGNAKILPLP